MPITVGLDLSLTGTGLVILKDGEILKQVLIKSKPRGDSPADEIIRLMKIRDDIMSFIDDVPVNEIELVAIEGLAFAITKTSSIMQLAALNYMVREALYNRCLSFVLVSPTSLKKFITGKGVGQKDVMMLETYKRYGVTLLDNNVCDGYGLARCAEAAICCEGLPKHQQEVAKLINKQI